MQPNYRLTDIKDIINHESNIVSPLSRDASFDYCFNYFSHIKFSNNNGFDMEKAVLMVFSYLSSWGMLRNSKLLSKSIKHFEPLVEYIASKEAEFLFNIDLNDYTDQNIDRLIYSYEIITSKVLVNDKQTHLTLVTKIMLGVFGCVPAFDTYFILGLSEISKVGPKREGLSVFNKKSLTFLKMVYDNNCNEICELAKNKHTIDYYSKRDKIKLSYTRAKILDLYGFDKGYKIANKNAIK